MGFPAPDRGARLFLKPDQSPDPVQNDAAAPESAPAPACCGGRGTLMLLGILSLIAGVVAIGSPCIAGGATAVFVGAMILVSGVFEIIAALGSRAWRAGILGALGGFLSAIAGVIIMARPMFALVVFTLVLAVFFFVTGIWRVILAFKLKPLPGWVWVLVSGIASVVLGVLIWRQWPLSGLWAVGTLVGIHILLNGVSLLALAGAESSAAEGG